MLILSIETSCDETGIALVEAKGDLPDFLENPRIRVLKNFVQSQIAVHEPYGGVVPNLAKREHGKNLPILYVAMEDFLKKKRLGLKAIDLVAVTVGPGLEPALWTGINFGKEIYSQIKKENKKVKILGVNHLEGHLFSLLIGQKSKIIFPALGLLVSGGHTILLLMKNKLTSWKKIGETRDDAVGESFDKVGRLLGLSYPAGPEMERRAKIGKPITEFPQPMLHQKNYDFSFSGLKTSVFYFLRDLNKKKLTESEKNGVAAAFQKAAFGVLAKKTGRAAEYFKAKSILIAGGVANNKALAAYVKKEVGNAKLFLPGQGLSGDNAVMIAVAGYIDFLRNKKRPLKANSTMNV